LSVRVSPISRGAALLIVVIGLFTYAYINDVAGIAFVALGIALYWLLYRFARRVRREVEDSGPRRSG
jgi:membrane protein implicated in regulation of membrane protease activity